MTVTLPSNLIMSSNDFSMKINGRPVTPSVNTIAFQLKAEVPVADAD